VCFFFFDVVFKVALRKPDHMVIILLVSRGRNLSGEIARSLPVNAIRKAVIGLPREFVAAAGCQNHSNQVANGGGYSDSFPIFSSHETAAPELATTRMMGPTVRVRPISDGFGRRDAEADNRVAK